MLDRLRKQALSLYSCDYADNLEVLEIVLDTEEEVPTGRGSFPQPYATSASIALPSFAGHHLLLTTGTV